MAVNIEFAKKHWPILTGGIVGLLLLFYLLRHKSASASSSTDISGGAGQVQAISAAADLQNSQANSNITMAAYQAGVANNGIAAGLQSDLAKTAAQLAAAQTATASKTVVALDTNKTAVELQKVMADATVKQTTIQGQTLVALGSQAAYIKQRQQDYVNNQVMNIMTHSKHFSTDIQNFTPTILAETGQGTSAVGVADANTRRAAATSPAATISAASGIASMLAGLFA